MTDLDIRYETLGYCISMRDLLLPTHHLLASSVMVVKCMFQPESQSFPKPNEVILSNANQSLQ